MGTRYTLEQAQQISIDKRATPLFTEYKNRNQKLEFRCKCGNLHSMRFSNILSGNSIPQCLKCSNTLKANRKEKVPIDVVKQKFEKYGSTLISLNYQNNSQDLEFLCKCGKLAYMRYSNIQQGRTPRCRECQLKFSYPKGSNHYKWNPNISDEEREIRNRGNAFYRWANEIRKQAKYTCIITGKRGRYLVAHHLYNWADYPDKRYDLSNGVCISKKLHDEFHRIYGKGNNTPEQFYVFMELKQKESEAA